MKQRSVQSPQRGLAVVTVLLILALMTTLMAFMVESGHIAIRRASNATLAEAAYQAAVTGEQTALILLKKDALEDIAQNSPATPVNDHRNEEWFKATAPPVATEDMEVSLEIIDESAQFNINNLYIGSESERLNQNDRNAYLNLVRSEGWRLGFVALLESLELDGDLSIAVEQWLDYDTEQNGRLSSMAAEDYEYLGEDTPYRTANRLFEDINELRKVKGFDDDEVFEKLRPYITALPGVDLKININTTEAQMFRILVDFQPGQAPAPVTEGVAETVNSYRNANAENGALNFQQTLDTTANTFYNATNFFDEKSRYFRIISRTKVDRLSYGIESLVKRTITAEGEVKMVVLQRRRTLG